MATAFTRTLSVGSRGRKTTSNVPVRAEEGRTKARRCLRGSGDVQATEDRASCEGGACTLERAQAKLCVLNVTRNSWDCAQYCVRSPSQ